MHSSKRLSLLWPHRLHKCSSYSLLCHTVLVVPSKLTGAVLSITSQYAEQAATPALTLAIRTTSRWFTSMPQGSVNSMHADCVSQDTVQDGVHSSSHNLRCVRRLVLVKNPRRSLSFPSICHTICHLHVWQKYKRKAKVHSFVLSAFSVA